MSGLWKYKIKTEHGTITLFKLWYVADGSIIQDDPDDVFSLVAHASTIQIVITLVSQFGVHLFSGNVPSAYVQADMPFDRDYYVTQPSGFEDPQHPDWVCRLKKAIYGVLVARHQ